MPNRAGIDFEFERVMRGESIRHPVHGGRGGEWDVLRSLPRGTLRTLTGARLLTPHGMFPDDAATHVIGPATGHFDTCEAMDWFARTAMLAIHESRARRHFERHQKVAKRHGYKTYYQWRTWLAIEMGFESVYQMRRHRWESPPTAPAR